MGHPFSKTGLCSIYPPKDEEVGNVTHLLKFEKGADFRSAGVLTHEFWEEVWILEGSLTDVTLSQTFPAGSYCCRPPGMKHGPYVSETGALMFEVRTTFPARNGLDAEDRGLSATQPW